MDKRSENIERMLPFKNVIRLFFGLTVLQSVVSATTDGTYRGPWFSSRSLPVSSSILNMLNLASLSSHRTISPSFLVILALSCSVDEYVSISPSLLVLPNTYGCL